MKPVTVTAPDETRWTVRVVWEPRWRVLARRFGGWRRRRDDRHTDPGDVLDGLAEGGEVALSGSGGGGSDPGGGDGDLGDAVIAVVLIFIVFVVAAALFWWVLLPLLLVVLDAVIVLLLLMLSVAGRVFLRRPWTVEATADGREKVTSLVVGWRAALRRRDELADSLRHGLRPADLTHVPRR